MGSRRRKRVELEPRKLRQFLICPRCGWHGQGVEADPCGDCGERFTVGCGPVNPDDLFIPGMEW